MPNITWVWPQDTDAKQNNKHASYVTIVYPGSNDSQLVAADIATRYDVHAQPEAFRVEVREATDDEHRWIVYCSRCEADRVSSWVIISFESGLNLGTSDLLAESNELNQMSLY